MLAFESNDGEIPMAGSILTDKQRAEYERDGYVIVRKLFDDEEIAILRAAIEGDEALRSRIYNRNDASGKNTRMAIWNHPGNSGYGRAARSHRVVDTMEDLLGGEVYHYHSKLTAKEPREGGAWEWHQDYGYWYHNGNVYPYMASLMVALDRSTRENGCLQVVKGSHHCGRHDPHRRLHRDHRCAAAPSTPTYCRRAETRSALIRCVLNRSSSACQLSTPRWNRAMGCFFTVTCCIVRTRTVPSTAAGR